MEHYQTIKSTKIRRRKKIACNFCFVLSALALFACAGMKQTKMDGVNNMDTANTTKVIGYFVPDRSDQMIDQIAWNRLSHVIFMGIDPDSSGTWQLQSGKRQASVLIPQIKAKNPNIRILGSVWGNDEIVKWIEEEGAKGNGLQLLRIWLNT